MVAPFAGGPSRSLGLSPNAWSLVPTPDSRQLAYTTVDNSAGRDKPWPAEIRMRSIDGREDRLLLRFADSQVAQQDVLSLSADGKFLLYRDPSLEIRILNTQTLEHWPLVTAPPAGVNFEWADARWSPDGSFVILEGFSSQTSWRAVDGLSYEAVAKLTGKGR